MFKQPRQSRFSFALCSGANKRRVFLVFILPILIAVAIGSLFYLNFFTNSNVIKVEEEKETFDWSDVDWEKSSIQSAPMPKRHPFHIFGEPIAPVKDSYMFDPRPITTLYAAVDNVTFDTYGYYIKGGVRYPTQHPWLVPQFEIEEDEKIVHRVDQAIGLYIPASFNKMDIILKSIHPLLALPFEIRTKVPIYTNSPDPIIQTLLGYLDIQTKLTVMEGAVHARTMWIIDYPEEDGFAYNEYFRYREMLQPRFEKVTNSHITLSKEFDIRLNDKQRTLDVITRNDTRIVVDSTPNNPLEKMEWFWGHPYFITFGNSDIIMAAFMRPNSHLILYTNKLDFNFGARYARFAGARVTVIVSPDHKLTATKRKIVRDIINFEIPEKEKIHDDDDEELQQLPVFDFNDESHEKELIEWENKLLEKAPEVEQGGSKKDLKPEVITPEPADN